MVDKIKEQADALKNVAEQHAKQAQLDLLARKALEHDKRFDAHDKQLDLLAAKALEHDKRFDGLEAEVGEVKKQVQGLNKKVTDFTDKVLSALDENTALLRDKRQEQEATSATLVGHGKAIGGHEKRITRLEQKVST